ncbi:hypothetical protein Tco_0084817 [Tanacetum coccineum]
MAIGVMAPGVMAIRVMDLGDMAPGVMAIGVMAIEVIAIGVMAIELMAIRGIATGKGKGEGEGEGEGEGKGIGKVKGNGKWKCEGVGPSVEERSILFLEAQDRLKKRPFFKVELLGLRESVLGLELGTRRTPCFYTTTVGIRAEVRLDQFVDQLADRMNDMMNQRRRGDRNDRRSKGEESKNLFFEGDSSSFDEQPGQPRRNQREDNRRWESKMRVNIPEFDGDTLNP